jgi:CRISPR-associated protein Csm3
MMPKIQLKGKLILKGSIQTVTGLHIGGAAAGLEIGGIDNPIIRHPVTRQPYIPGSSLRGKLRSLLERHHGKPQNKLIREEPPRVCIHECDDEEFYENCDVCNIFGITPGDARKAWTGLKPTRLAIRDVLLSQSWIDEVQTKKARMDLPYTEVKWEAAIDRITSAAVPRQNERVPAGAVFAPFEFVYSLYDLNGTGCQQDIEWLRFVFKAMEYLEDDFLGGYGSRGAGKIAFAQISVVFKSHAYYDGKADAETLDQDKTVRDLDSAGYAARIRDLILG